MVAKLILGIFLTTAVVWTFSAAASGNDEKTSDLGTIHILRKQFYSTKIILTSKFFTKTGFFRQIKRISFSTVHFDEIFML